MSRPRYQIAEEDVPVVHRWVYAKLHDTTWPQPDATRTAWHAAAVARHARGPPRPPDRPAFTCGHGPALMPPGHAGTPTAGPPPCLTRTSRPPASC